MLMSFQFVSNVALILVIVTLLFWAMCVGRQACQFNVGVFQTQSGAQVWVATAPVTILAQAPRNHFGSCPEKSKSFLSL